MKSLAPVVPFYIRENALTAPNDTKNNVDV